MSAPQTTILDLTNSFSQLSGTPRITTGKTYFGTANGPVWWRVKTCQMNVQPTGSWRTWVRQIDKNGGYITEGVYYDIGYMFWTRIDNVGGFELVCADYNGSTSLTPANVVKFEIEVMPANDWYGDGGYPDNDWFQPRPAVLEGADEDLPIWAFRQDDMINFGYPYNVLVPDLVHITLNPVRQREYICVYDIKSEKIDFLTNGLAILCPTEATIHEILNGEYSLTLKHPMDALGKWKFIREENIVKCLGQIFRIKRVEWNHTSENTGTLTAYAEHIFYDLNDCWIYGLKQNADAPTFAYCISAINSIMRRYVTLDEGEMYRYDFDWSSDWEWGGNNGWTLFIDGAGQTPVEKLIGEGGLIAYKGGELYRDNFHFSINERMENAEDNAFELRFGSNLCGLKRTVDCSTVAFHLTISDETVGFHLGVSYAGNSFPRFQFPHNVPRSFTVRYEENFYQQYFSGDISASEVWARLYSDLITKFKATSLPVLCYEVDVKDLKNVFPELTDHYRFRVGNTGTIYDSLLFGNEKVTLKITETEVDGITGDVKRITIGSKNSFTRSAGYPQEYYDTPSETTYELPIIDSTGKLLFDSREKQIMRRGTL